MLQLSHSWGQALGSLTLPLREVLMEPGLVLDRWFSLEGALPESQVLMRVTLKVRLITSHTCLNSLPSLVCAGVHCNIFLSLSISISLSTAGVRHSAGCVPQGSWRCRRWCYRRWCHPQMGSLSPRHQTEKRVLHVSRNPPLSSCWLLLLTPEKANISADLQTCYLFSICLFCHFLCSVSCISI